MSRALDAAIESAHKPTKSVKPPVVEAAPPPKPAAKPKQVAGHRVRLRGLKYPLDLCVVNDSGFEERVSLIPNKLTSVSPAMYEMLKSKFHDPAVTEVVSWNGDPNQPQRETRQESAQQYILEFPDELD